MKKILLCFALFGLFELNAQQEIKSDIKQVTVFASSAQIEREVSATLKTGEQTLVFTGLSPHLVANSIRVRTSNKNVLVRQQGFKTEYVETDVNEANIKLLYQKLETKKRAIELLYSQKAGLLKEREFLDQNTDINGARGMNMNLTQFQQTGAYFRKKMESIATELYDLEVQRKAQVAEMNQIVLDLKKASSRKTEITGSIQLLVDSKSAGSTTFFIEYLVNNAGWTPQYELKVDEVGKPASLELKANLVQVTDVEWKNVKLIFSTGDPQRSSQVPMLQPWYITQPVAQKTIYNKPQVNTATQGYTGRFFGAVVDAQTNEALPYATVVFYGPKGDLIDGVITDFDGGYNLVSNEKVMRIQISFLGYQTQTLNAPAGGQMNIRLNPETQSLQEVVITAERPMMETGRTSNVSASYYSMDSYEVLSIDKASTREVKIKQASVINYNANQVRKAITQQFEALVPYTVKADGEEMSISLQTFSLPVDYRYTAIPKLDDDAFLEAQLFGWDTLGLVSGQLKLYLEGSFVGVSSLNVESLEDTLSMSLGRDPNVVIKRTNVPDVYRKSFFGGKRMRNVAYRLEVRNNKKVPITITLQDQFPLSPDDEITIKRGEVEGGKVDAETGIITWLITLKPGEQIMRTINYEVTYPKNRNVYF